MNKVSLIIPTLNEEEHIEKLLKSLIIQDYLNYEIIVVDGGSKDRTLEIAKQHGVKVLKEKGKKKCPANAINQGVKTTNAEIVCLMNADQYVNKGFIRNAVRHFSDENVMAVIPSLIPTGDTLVERVFNKSSEIRSLFHVFWRKIFPKKVQFQPFHRQPPVWHFWRRKDFLNIGGYPIIGYLEFNVFQRKAAKYLKKTGKTFVFENRSKLHFHYSHSLLELFKSYSWYGRTIPLFLKITKDFVTGVGSLLYFFSFLTLLLVAVQPFFLIPASLYIVKLFATVGLTLKKRNAEYLLTPLIDIVEGVGEIHGFISYLYNKSLSRQ